MKRCQRHLFRIGVLLILTFPATKPAKPRIGMSLLKVRDRETEAVSARWTSPQL